jgi:hypothetical protein
MKSLFAFAKRGNKNIRPSGSDSSQFDTDRSTLNSRSGVSSYIETPNHYQRSLNRRESQTTASLGSSIPRQPPPNIDQSQRNVRLSRKIATLSQGLRDMYSLDLKIFGTQGIRPEDNEKRNKNIEKANMLFTTVVVTLDELGAENWTEEERAVIQRIRLTAKNLDPRQYRRQRGNTM